MLASERREGPKAEILVVGNDLPTRRGVSKALLCAGVKVTEYDSVDPARDHAQGARSPGLVIVEAPQFEEALRDPSSWNHWWLLCLAPEENTRWFELAVEHDIVCGIIGCSEEAMFPTTQLLSVGRRLVLRRAPPPSAPLTWGHLWHERSVANVPARNERIEEVQGFAEKVCGGRVAGKSADIVDEFLMNAMYDAPVDAAGKPLYAHDRKARVELDPNQQPLLGFGADGHHLVISVSDPFGRLQRRSVFESMHRGLTTGAMDTSGGGAGLGMSIIYRNACAVFFDVEKRTQTQVTAMVELGRKPRKTGVPNSVFFFEYPPRSHRK